uniref:Actin filament-associated protein 1-like 2 n=1 Tax=Periophthalmus magnuspinnatus TaxID=409849 RepID=A0A3B4B1F3_9GOBI
MERIKEKKKSLLDRLLVELHRFLLILDKENLSGNATVHKSMLSDLLQTYRGPAGMGTHSDISKTKLQWKNRECLHQYDRADSLVNGKAGKFSPVPQKNLPELPPPRTVSAHGALIASLSHFPDDGEAVSSSYESYDEEEVTKGKCPSAQHQWPSAEAPFELMRDSRICAFLWRKKWLGQWAKQLCVIRDDRLMCYKSSKEQTPLLDVSLLGCSVVYKEKQLKRKEHRLKIVPMGGEAIVLGLQSREQTEQWLKVKFPQQELMLKQTFVSCKNYTVSVYIPQVIQEISPKPAENDRYSVASESGSSTDSHTETCENKDVKKKFQFSNLMNIGKKKPLSLESPEKCIDTSGYLNVLVNSQWRTCWCLIKNGQLWFYQDKNKSKISQPAVSLEGCSVCPDPSPEHLYSFRIHSDGTQLTTLEAKTSADMGHWLGLLLSQMGSKTNPEDLTYDYVNAERISSIVNAAKTSLYLMQRRYSEPNTYIDTPPSFSQNSDELYDDVASLPDPEEDADSKIYLDLIPVRSFLHTSVKDSPGKNTVPEFTEQHIEPKEVSISDLCVYVFLASHGAVEVKLGKNRTEADLRRYRDEREHLEREREEVRSSLANLKKERSEVKEELTACQDPKEQAALEARLKEKDEACREAERRRVEVELQLVEVKENLKKAESGPFTLGTTLDLQDTVRTKAHMSSLYLAQQCPPKSASPVNSASALKNRPVSIMATKGKVLQKAKVLLINYSELCICQDINVIYSNQNCVSTLTGMGENVNHLRSFEIPMNCD